MEPTQTLEMMKTDKQFGSDPSLAKEIEKAELLLRSVKDMIENGNISELYTDGEVADIVMGLFDDPCPCNYNDNDEWLGQYCDEEKSCDEYNPEGDNRCWKLWLRYREEKHE